MFRRIISSALAATILTTSSLPVSAQTFIYRHKYPISVSYQPVDEIAPENDIKAEFFAVLGRPFSKALPISNADVVEWRIERGDTVSGIELDRDSGTYGGVATSAAPVNHIAYGYDGRGVRIARADVTFRVFEPQGVRAEIDFYAHVGRYFFADIPTPPGIDVFKWVPFIDEAPGMETRVSAYEGEPTQTGTFPLAYQGYNAFDEPVAYAEGQLLVEDGPKVADILDQAVDKQANQKFSRKAVVARSIGKVSYKLVPVDQRPDGVTFDSLGGAIGGVYDEFETSAQFYVEATDNGDGTTKPSNTFTLSTLPAILDISKINDKNGAVGSEFGPYTIRPGVRGQDLKWTLVQGQWPLGVKLDVDPATGYAILSGVPEKREIQTGLILEVSGPGIDPVRSRAFQININEQGFYPFTTTFKGRTGLPITTQGVCLTGRPRNGVCTPPKSADVYEYRLLADLPDGFTFDTATGIISSVAGVAEPGYFSIPMVATVGGEDRSNPFNQTFNIRSPLSIGYQPEADGYPRRQNATLSPEIDTADIFGTKAFKLVSGKTPGSWLRFDSDTGVFTVRPTQDSHIGTYEFEVSLNDDIGPAVSSGKFTVVVTDRKNPSPTLRFDTIQRLVTNTQSRFVWAENLYAPSRGGEYTFKVVDGRGTLPPGLTLSEDGYLRGTTTAATGSVWTDIVIEVTDTLTGERAYVGDNATAPFSVTVVDPKGLGAISGNFDKEFDWAVGKQLSMEMPKASGTTGTVTYTLAAPQIGDLAVVDGFLVGSVPDVGDYQIAYTIKDESARPESQGTITLHIHPAMTLGAADFWDGYKHTWFEKAPEVFNGIAPVVYTLLPATVLPPERDWSLSADGKLKGMPTEQDISYPVSIRVTDAAKTTKTFNTTLRLNKPLDFTFSYPTSRLVVGDSGSPLLTPKIVNGTAPYSFKLLSGDIPGLGLTETDPVGKLAGSFSGKATTAGLFEVAITATDANGLIPSPVNPVRHEVVVGYPGSMSLTGSTFVRRVGKSFSIPLTAENAVFPKFSATTGSLPSGISLDPSGILSGKFDTVGTFGGIGVTVTEDSRFAQLPSTATFAVETKDYPVVEASTAMSFTQYVESSVAIIRTDNIIGEATFVEDPDAVPLPEGLSVNAQTGAVEGTPSVPGTTSGHRILVVDTYGSGETDSRPSAEFSVTVAERPQLDIAYGDGVAAFEQYKSAEVPSTVLNAAPGAIVYSVSPALPAGVSLGSDGRIIATTPELASSSAVYTVTAKDPTGVAGDAKGVDTFDVTVSVARRPELQASIAGPVTFTRHVASKATAAVVNDAAYGDVEFEVLTGAPSSITFTGADLGGVTASPTGAYTIRVKATDATFRDHGDGRGVVEFDVPAVVADLPALDFGYAAPIRFKQHAADSGITPAPASPAVGTVRYSVSPAPPECITFDTASGTFGTTGCTNVIATSTYQVTAADDRFAIHNEASGRKQVTVDITVDKRDQMTLSYPDYDTTRLTFDFQRHKTATAAAEPKGQLTTALTWTITPALPQGLEFDELTGAIGVNTASIIAAADYLVKVTDGKDGEAEALLSIGVRERDQIDFTTLPAQQIPLNTVWELTASIENQIGPATFEMVSGDLPTDIQFDAVGIDGRAAGTFYGTPDVADHGKTFTVRIKVTDGFDGKGEQDFSFTVVEDATPISLTYGDPGRFRVGYAASVAAPTLTDTVGNHVFTAPSLAAFGLSIDPKSGAISGFPNSVFETDVEVTVTDKVRSLPVMLHLVSVPSARTEIGSTVSALYNRDVDPLLSVKAYDAAGVQNWTVAPILPNGLSIDPATGAFLGQPEVIGRSGPYVLTMTDELPGSFPTAPFYLDIKMNDDPIEMASPVILTKVGFDVAMAVGEYDNEYGTPRFSSPELAALGLSVDPDTGEITGKVNEVYKGTPNIVIKDDTLRTTTVPVDLTVLPKMVLVAPKTISLNAQETMADRKITAQAVAGDLTWEPVDPTLLPPDVTFDTATGTFSGTPAVIGTYGPFKVAAVDTFGAGQIDRQESDEITIVVRKGALYVNLLGDTIPQATKREDYAFDFKTLVDPETQGVDVSELKWSFSGNPDGLQIDRDTGVISGVPSLSGDYVVTVTASALGRSWPKTYQIKVVLPKAGLELAGVEGSLPGATRAVTGEDHSYSYDLLPLLKRTNIPEEDVKWTVEPAAAGEAFPANFSVVKGVLSGTTNSPEGTYTFRVTASYTNGPDEFYTSTATYTVKVTDTIKIDMAALEDPITGKKRAAFSHDFEPYAKVEGFDRSKLTWTFSVDPNRDQTTTMADMPKGVPATRAVLSGTFVNSGTYAIQATASYDGRSKAQPYMIVVSLPDIDLALAATSLPEARAADQYTGFNFTSVLTAKNIPVSEVVWSVTPDAAATGTEVKGLPSGIDLDPKTGRLSGKPTTSGQYVFRVKATWDNADLAKEHEDTFVDVKLVVAGLAGFKQISSGDYFTCGIRDNGSLWCWGNNSDGQLGDGTTSYRVQPGLVSGMESGVTNVAAGREHVCAVKDGGVYCWGNNSDKQTANSTSTRFTTPSRMSYTTVSSGVRQVAAGETHSCALRNDGTVYCWGSNTRGQLGDGSTRDNSTPQQVSGLTQTASIALGSTHTCAIKTNGSLWCWGYNVSGQLGNGTTSTTAVTAPASVPGFESGTASVVAAPANTCAVKTDSSAWCWGAKTASRLGNPDHTEYRVPGLVSGMDSGAASLAFGVQHGCAVKTDGSVWCWGVGTNGRLGDGTEAERSTPVKVVGVSDAVAVSAGYYNGCALTKDGSVWCWGRKIGTTPAETSFTPYKVE